MESAHTPFMQAIDVPEYVASTPEVRLRDIWRLTAGALVADIVTYVAFHESGASSFVSVVATVSAGSLWWIVGYQRLGRIRGWDSLKVRFAPVGGRRILAGVLGGIALTLLPAGLALILELMGIQVGEVPAQAGAPDSLRQLPLAIAGVVVLGPLSEELIFRGLLLDWLSRRMLVWPAAIIISLAFAFLHNMTFKDGVFGWIAFVVRFVLGIAASYLAVRHRSLRAAWVMHATMNGCACLLAVLRGGS